MPSVSFLFFLLLLGTKLASNKGSRLGQRAGLEGASTRRVAAPALVRTDLIYRLERAAGPGSMSSPAPHTEQFIHEPPGPALEGAVGRRFRRESGVGKGPIEGEGARFVPPGRLDRLVRTVPKLVVVLPRKNKDAREVGKRGQRGRLPLELCAATRLGPLIGSLAAGCSELGALLPT